MRGNRHRRENGTSVLLGCIAVWTLFELPFELIFSETARDRIAAILGAIIWLLLIIGAISRLRFARSSFTFLCGLSALVIAFTISSEYAVSTIAFILSAVECLLKAFAFIVLKSIWIERKIDK